MKKSTKYIATPMLAADKLAIMKLGPQARGQRIRECRMGSEKFKTQAALAKGAHISQPSLSAIETGRTKEPKHSTIVAIAAVLGVNPFYFTDVEGQKVLPVEKGMKEKDALELFLRLGPDDQALWISIGKNIIEKRPPPTRPSRPTKRKP